MLGPLPDLGDKIGKTKMTVSTGLEKPGRLLTESGLNDHLERHECATGPLRCSSHECPLQHFWAIEPVTGMAQDWSSIPVRSS